MKTMKLLFHMRKSSLLFLLMMLTGFAYGETMNGEMLCEGNEWFYMGYYTIESYNIRGTQTKNGKTYGLLHMYHKPYDDTTPQDYSNTTIGIRDEGGRIYVDKEEYLSLLSEDHYWSLIGEGESLPYEETADGELVLYDFNKNVGDVYCQLTDGTSLTVTNVCELKTEDGISRRRLTLSNGLDLIEGVGCTNSNGFLMFWLNVKPRINYKGLLTEFGTTINGSFMYVLRRDYDATINELNGNPNKMLTQGRRWVYDYDNGEMKGTLTYTVEGDTLLYAYKRAKVYMTLTDNETKKVVRSGYIGAFNEVREYLCYLAPDSLEAMPLYNFSEYYPRVFECNGILRNVVNDDSIMVGNEKLHRIQMLNIKGLEPLPLEKDSLYYWVEGIGSSKGLLEYYAGTLMDSIQFVECYDGDERFFTKEDFEKEGNQPSKFCNSLRIGPLSYNIELGSKTARVLPSDSYQTMSSINIPSSVELWGIACKVTAINDRAFYDCNAITSVEISEGVVEIGEEAFRKCESITSLSLPSTLVTIKDEGFFGLKSLTSLVLPENLKTIGGWAFQTCLKLKELDIPASVESIGRYAFSHCQSLENVYCRATTLPTTDETRQLRDINPEAVLHVPAASIEAYRSTAPWSNFKYIVPIETQVAYRPFLKEGKTWNVVGLRPVDSAETDTTDYYDILGRKGRVNQRISYVIDGDTVIGGVTYKKLLSNGYFAGGLREEDGRVYGCGWSQTQSYDEKLLYDFNAQIGDVFMNGNGSEKLQVNHVLKVDVNGQSRRCLEMYHYYVGNGVEYYSGGKDYWIEGVGCTGSLIDPFWWGTLSSAYPLLLSCYEDGECIYTCEDFNNQINSMPDIAYRPFIEEGKVWKVGTIPSSLDSPVQIVDCYYLDGDTIIDGKTYKQMMRQRYISPDYPDYDYMSQQPSLSKVGAWYEEDQKVYFYDEDHQVVQLKYDFSLGANEKLDFLNGKFVIGPRQTGLEGFKGVYRDIMMYGDEGDNPFYTTWLEGVGGIDGPIRNVCDPMLDDPIPEFLMSCSVGDEVIYLNDNYEDGASLDAAGARKDRFDFTHTVKVEPKTPRRSQGQEPLYGEYNNLQLDIHLDLLDDAYLVCITDESGKAVYQKAINAGSIVGLNIDISAYAKGRYTVTVENSLETFTGEFEVQTTGVTEVIYNKVKASNTIFNLQGQRISSLQKGLNIVNGRKVVIK